MGPCKQEKKASRPEQPRKGGAKPNAINVSKETILAGKFTFEPSTKLLIDELHKQRQSSRAIIEAKNKLIADLAQQIRDRSLEGCVPSEHPSKETAAKST